MVQLIVYKINAKIQYVKHNIKRKTSPLLPWSSRTDIAYKILFFKTVGHPVFSGTTSKHRFSCLCSVISFDDPEETRQLWKTDGYVATRALTNMDWFAAA